MSIKTLMVSLLVGAASIACAQSPTFHFFRSAQPFDRSQYKVMIAAVADADPMAAVFHSDDMTIVQVKAGSGLPAESYRQALLGAGIQLLPGTLSPEEVHPAAQSDLPPVFIATGDEAADMARYQAAVQAWNATHPDNTLSPIPVHLR